MRQASGLYARLTLVWGSNDADGRSDEDRRSDTAARLLAFAMSSSVASFIMAVSIAAARSIADGPTFGRFNGTKRAVATSRLIGMVSDRDGSGMGLRCGEE